MFPQTSKNKSLLLLCVCLEGQMPNRAHPTRGQEAYTYVLFKKIISYASILTWQLYSFTSPTRSPWKWASSVPVEAKISPRSRFPYMKICHENQGKIANPWLQPIFFWKPGLGNNSLLAIYKHVSKKLHSYLGLWAKIFQMGSETRYQYKIKEFQRGKKQQQRNTEIFPQLLVPCSPSWTGCIGPNGLLRSLPTSTTPRFCKALPCSKFILHPLPPTLLPALPGCLHFTQKPS